MRIIEIRALLPVSWHYEDYEHFDPPPTPAPAPAHAGARFGSELRSICVSEAEAWTHVRAGSPLHNSLAWGALKRDLSDHVDRAKEPEFVSEYVY